VSRPSHKRITINNRASDATSGTEETELDLVTGAEKGFLIPDSCILTIPFEITYADWDRDLYQSGDIILLSPSRRRHSGRIFCHKNIVTGYK
jgi:hypothetical protein